MFCRHQVRLSLRQAISWSQAAILARTTSSKLLPKECSIIRNNHGKTVVVVSTLCRHPMTFSLASSCRQPPATAVTIHNFTSISIGSSSSRGIYGNRGRLSSSSTNPPDDNNNNTQTNLKSDPWDDGSGNSTELAQLTPGQKFQVGTRLTLWVGIGAFAAACAYWIIKELVPTKMSPNSVFDRAFHVLRDNSEIQQRFGEPLKAYGRDHGGHREGRRNFVENTQYQCKEDGSNRTRIRFNLEGKFGHAYVFAEVSSDMPSGEFVYLLVQDKRNGRVITIIDNRTALTVRRMAGESKEGNEVLHNLLVGSSSSSKK